MEAVASTSTVITNTAAGAISALNIAISLKRVRSRRALDERAVRTSATQIANATHMHLSIPGSTVCARGFCGQLFLSKAHTGFIAVVGAHGALTGNAIIVGKALAFTSLAITQTFARALNAGMSIIAAIHIANPGITKRARSG